MSNTLESLRHKMNGAGDLKSVVHSMKALAASSINQYEKSVLSLADYYHAIEMGLATCLRQGVEMEQMKRKGKGAIGAIIFGSDQGLIGQFNNVLVDYFRRTLGSLPGKKMIWAVGERVQSCLVDGGYTPAGLFSVPNSVTAITPLIGQILIACETSYEKDQISQLHVFHNRFLGGAVYEPASQFLFPMDKSWQAKLARVRWPTRNLPEVLTGARLPFCFALQGVRGIPGQ
jgi:F-type H+-transporting ATPase subunit gamma